MIQDSRLADNSRLGHEPAPPPETAAPADARGDARRSRILEIARTLFFENGYQGTSMSMIAAQVGGSKSTLYAYYRSKEELFRAIIQAQCDEMMDLMRVEFRHDTDVRAVLTELARGFINMLMRDSTIRTFLLVAAESRQAPELAHIFNSAGPARTKVQLADYFRAAAVTAKLDIADPVTACEHFAALCKGELWFNRLLNLSAPPTQQEITAHADQIVTVFMAAYRHRTPE